MKHGEVPTTPACGDVVRRGMAAQANAAAAASRDHGNSFAGARLQGLGGGMQRSGVSGIMDEMRLDLAAPEMTSDMNMSLAGIIGLEQQGRDEEDAFRAGCLPPSPMRSDTTNETVQPKPRPEPEPSPQPSPQPSPPPSPPAGAQPKRRPRARSRALLPRRYPPRPRRLHLRISGLGDAVGRLLTRTAAELCRGLRHAGGHEATRPLAH